MTTDPSDPTDPGTGWEQGGLSTIAPDVPQADAVEQHRDLLPHGDDHPAGATAREAAEADVAEQARVVEGPEEDEGR
ncbi:hypothetical protein [Kitasatospora sp. NBC_00315]|uniref:hypothetical protein n=1 Tax=Kitasatospora sp. NBC_00315 TaxID=2975963 RepID=UPI00324E8DFC